MVALNPANDEIQRPLRGPFPVRLAIVGCAWLGTICAGFVWLGLSDAQPGSRGAPPVQLAAVPELQADSGLVSLTCFIHPQCPCTRATLRDLERVATHVRETAQLRVVVAYPSDHPEWMSTATVAFASTISGVRIVPDPGGLLTAACGVKTSGHTLIYGPEGDLRYSGGLVPLRNHEGNAETRDCVLQVIESQPKRPVQTPAFGCPMYLAAPSTP